MKKANFLYRILMGKSLRVHSINVLLVCLATCQICVMVVYMVYVVKFRLFTADDYCEYSERTSYG